MRPTLIQLYPKDHYFDTFCVPQLGNPFSSLYESKMFIECNIVAKNENSLLVGKIFSALLHSADRTVGGSANVSGDVVPVNDAVRVTGRHGEREHVDLKKQFLGNYF